MEKESITGLMLDPDSFYGAVSVALDRFEGLDGVTERPLG